MRPQHTMQRTSQHAPLPHANHATPSANANGEDANRPVTRRPDGTLPASMLERVDVKRDALYLYDHACKEAS